MAINLGGLARGVSAGLRDYALIKDIKNRDEQAGREKEEFGWKKKDREKADKYQAEIDDLTAKHPAMVAINTKEQPQPPAATGLTPANPADAAVQSVVPGATPQPGASPPLAAAENAPATGLKPVPQAPKQTPGFNDLTDFAMRRAMIDVRHGKLDGVGLLNLSNSIKSLEQSKFGDALEQMDAGNIEQGFSLLNANNKAPKEFVSAKDGVYEVAGTKLPTKLITYRNADGSLSTLNTAQSRVQRLSMEKIIEAAQKGDVNTETRRHNKETEKAGMITAQAHKTSAGAKSKDEKGSLTQKDGLNVLRERFGGKLDAMGQWSMDDKNKDVAMRSYVIYQENLKTMEELPAAQKAADQAEREKATGKLPKTATGASDAGSATGTGKSGRDWKSLGAIP